jgi:hypothetical protein
MPGLIWLLQDSRVQISDFGYKHGEIGWVMGATFFVGADILRENDSMDNLGEGSWFLGST